MYITIDETDRRPIYQQVVDEIKAIIASGELPEGSALPPVRQVAADLGVNLNTVAVAYRKLQETGLISIKHGSGAVVISQLAPKGDEERLQSKLMPVLTDMVLAGMTRSEVLAMVSTSLKRLTGDKSGDPMGR